MKTAYLVIDIRVIGGTIPEPIAVVIADNRRRAIDKFVLFYPGFPREDLRARLYELIE